MKTSIARLLPGETVEFTVTRRTDMQERANAEARRNFAMHAMSRVLHGDSSAPPLDGDAPLTLTVDDVFTRSQLYNRTADEKRKVIHTQTIGEFRQSIGLSVRQVKQAFKDRRFTVRHQLSYDYEGEFGEPCTAVHVNAKFFVTRIR